MAWNTLPEKSEYVQWGSDGPIVLRKHARSEPRPTSSFSFYFFSLHSHRLFP